MNKPAATLLVDQCFAEIKASLARGQAVKLSGFGNYELRDRDGAPPHPETAQFMDTVLARAVTSDRDKEFLAAMFKKHNPKG